MNFPKHFQNCVDATSAQDARDETQIKRVYPSTGLISPEEHERHGEGSSPSVPRALLESHVAGGGFGRPGNADEETLVGDPGGQSKFPPKTQNSLRSLKGGTWNSRETDSKELDKFKTKTSEEDGKSGNNAYTKVW